MHHRGSECVFIFDKSYLTMHIHFVCPWGVLGCAPVPP